MTSGSRAAVACATVVAVAAVLGGCQGKAAGPEASPSGAATVGGPPSSPSTPSPTPAPTPTPTPTDDLGLAPGSSGSDEVPTGEGFPGAAPGSDACRQAWVQQTLLDDPTFFDRRPVENPVALLEFDRLSGTISADEHARWGLQRIFEPDAVPPEYRLPDLSDQGTDPLTVISLLAMWEMECLPTATQQWVLDYTQTAPMSTSS